VLKRAATAAAKTAPGEASAAETPASAPAGTCRTSPWRRYKHLVHVARHAVHAVGEEYGIESGHAVGRSVPRRRILHDAGKRVRPVMLHSQSHGVGQVLLESVWRHSLEALGVNAVHEFLKAENGDPGARPFQSLGGHHAGKEPPDDRRNCHAQN